MSQTNKPKERTCRRALVICYFDSGKVEPVEKNRTNDLSCTISSRKIDGVIFLVGEKIEARPEQQRKRVNFTVSI